LELIIFAKVSRYVGSAETVSDQPSDENSLPLLCRSRTDKSAWVGSWSDAPYG